jgi:hypothetical protein
MVINWFPVERRISLRERISCIYYASAYFIAKFFADMLVQTSVTTIFVGEINLSKVFILFFFVCLQSSIFYFLYSFAATSVVLMIQQHAKQLK